MAAPIAERRTAAAPTAAPVAGREVLMTVKVVPRSEASVFRDTTLVYLDGPIDAGAPDRLSSALRGIDGKVTVWLNSPGGNLFAGMQLGRIIREHGAWTHIIDSRTLRPGECYSACAVAFLGGVHRFSDHGARYGVHRASLPMGSASGDVDLGRHLSAAIADYIREMGVDARLLDLWMKAGPDEMYVLSPQQATDLGVVSDGKKSPEWSVSKFSGGTMLQGRQATAEGTGQVFFSCDGKRTVFGSVDGAAGQGALEAGRRWSHVLTIDGGEEIPVTALGVSSKDGVVRSTFILSPPLVGRAMAAREIGHRMRSSSGSSALGVSVEIDDKSAPLVRKFLRDCLRAQAR